MKDQAKIILKGSFKKSINKKLTPSASPDDTIDVTVRLRRKKELEISANSQPISHESYETEYGADQQDVTAVTAFADKYGISVKEVSLSRRSVILSGKLDDFEKAFNVKLLNAKDDASGDIRVREGDIYIPEDLKDIVVGVFGLDDRPVARPMFKIAKQDGKIVSHAQSPASFTPDKLAEIYGFPAGVNGKGQNIAIIELGGGYRKTDLSNYFKSLNIPEPAVSFVAIDKGKNSPSNANGADGEVMLDIEVAGAVAPGAGIVVYFTKNTDKGFLDAITSAIHDKVNNPSIISISWGSAEVNWTQQALSNFNDAFKSAAILGVTICVAAGDSGSSDSETDGKVHVDFPASSPYVLACGGTSLKVTGNKITSEVVWHDSNTSASGGGISENFPLPDYQVGTPVPVSLNTEFKGRGLPDVAGNADPDTGYNVLVDGQEMVIGGTSAVAPLMAGLLARLNELSGKRYGFINPLLYKNPSFCRDIIKGNNKTTSKKTGYVAAKGWDPCTGWGVLSKLS